MRLIPGPRARGRCVAVRARQRSRAQPPQTGPAGNGTPVAVLAPPAALRVDGFAAGASLTGERDRPYGDFSITRFVSWHPSAPEMLVMRRAGNTAQLFLLTDPMGKPHQLTRGRDPVRDALFEPRRETTSCSPAIPLGDEATQLYRLDPKTLAETPLTPLASSTRRGRGTARRTR